MKPSLEDPAEENSGPKARFLVRHGPILAGFLAASVSLPGLWVPFLADDWALLSAVAQGPAPYTPFGYFRPLTQATFWIDRSLWGMSPALFHLTNLILIASAAALVVLAIRRYTGSSRLASLAGLLFALHPYHVENAGWVAARADPLFTVFLLGALLSYDRWRNRARGVPLTAIALFEAALLSKEAAVSLPAFLLIQGLWDRTRRPNGVELVRGYLPIIGVAVVHFVGLSRAVIGGTANLSLQELGIPRIPRFLGFATAAVLPAHIEILEPHPLRGTILALLVVILLLGLARAGSGGIPKCAWAASLAFVAFLAPSLLSFQARYFFLPSAASCLGLASLVFASRRWGRLFALALLIPSWLLFLSVHWIGWIQAGRASARLIGDLVSASRIPGAEEILVANLPYRVHGVAIAGNPQEAVALSGGRRVSIRFAVGVDYPDDRTDGLEDPLERAIRHSPPFVEVRLRIKPGRFSRYALPLPAHGSHPLDGVPDAIAFDGRGGVRIRIRPGPPPRCGTYVWRRGNLQPLARDAPSL